VCAAKLLRVRALTAIDRGRLILALPLPVDAREGCHQ
jgi:hypothetical protein